MDNLLDRLKEPCSIRSGYWNSCLFWGNSRCSYGISVLFFNIIICWMNVDHLVVSEQILNNPQILLFREVMKRIVSNFLNSLLYIISRFFKKDIISWLNFKILKNIYIKLTKFDIVHAYNKKILIILLIYLFEYPRYTTLLNSELVKWTILLRNRSFS